MVELTSQTDAASDCLANLVAKKRRALHPERLKLTPEAAQQIDAWTVQVAPRILGRRLSRADLVNWLVLHHDAHLSEAELALLHAAYFDPIRTLEWAVREAKAAHARGEAVDVQGFVNQSFGDTGHVPQRPRRQRARRAAKDTSEPDGRNDLSPGGSV